MEARTLLETSLELLGSGEPDESMAALSGTLGTMLFFAGEVDSAGERVEDALEIAEVLWLPEILAAQLITKSFVLDVRGRRAEALGILKYALELALENDLPSEAIRAYGNLSHQMQTRDRYQEALDYGRSALALARRIGDRQRELENLVQNFALFATGQWDEALSRVSHIPEWESQPPFILTTLSMIVLVHVARGELEEADAVLRFSDRLEVATDVESRATLAMARACRLGAEADPSAAVAAGRQAMEARHQEGWGHECVKIGFVEAVDAALALGDLSR